MTLHERYGLSQVINAAGSFTPLGVSRSSAGVARATGEALTQFFVIDQLQDALSAAISHHGSGGGCGGALRCGRYHPIDSSRHDGDRSLTHRRPARYTGDAHPCSLAGRPCSQLWAPDRAGYPARRRNAHLRRKRRAVLRTGYPLSAGRPGYSLLAPCRHPDLYAASRSIWDRPLPRRIYAVYRDYRWSGAGYAHRRTARDRRRSRVGQRPQISGVTDCWPRPRQTRSG